MHDEANERQPIGRDQIEERAAPVHFALKHGRRHFHADTRRLHHGGGDDRAVARVAEQADDSFPADGGHLDHSAVGHDGQLRAEAVAGKIEVADRCAGLMKHLPRPQRNDFEMRIDAGVIVWRKSREQEVGRFPSDGAVGAGSDRVLAIAPSPLSVRRVVALISQEAVAGQALPIQGEAGVSPSSPP